MDRAEIAEPRLAANGPNRQCWRVAAICLALAGMIFAVFGQTLRHQFIYLDDNEYVFNNPVVARGLTPGGIRWAFSTMHAQNWHPLTWLSHMFDCQLFGLNPGGQHGTSVLIHAAAAMALFLVLRRMTGAFWPSAMVAAIFGVHPLRVESVAWIAERKDVLSGLFFMLTVGAYVRYARRPSLVRYGLVMLLFAMGLMCKPMLVTAPVVLLLLDYWPLRRGESAGRLVLEKLPLLAFSIVDCVLTFLAQGHAVQSIETYAVPLRLANAAVTVMIYVGQMFWPAGLAVFYPYPHDGLPGWEVSTAAAFMAGVSALVWRRRRTQPWLLVGWLWYLIMLLPVAGIVQVGTQAHADRYTYLPQIGICVAVVWQASEWFAQWRVSQLAAGALMAAVVGALMVCAWEQTRYWRDSETLWRHTLACTTDNYTAHSYLGVYLIEKGRTDEAIAQYEDALKINPNDAETHYSLGVAMAQQGKIDEATAEFEKTLELNPNNPAANNNIGSIYLQQGRVDEAIAHLETAISVKPNLEAAHSNLAAALLKKGRTDDALAQFREAARVNPGDPQAVVDLGGMLLQAGKAREAIPYLQRAAEISPGSAEVQNVLGNALTQTGDFAGAIDHYQRATKIAPADPWSKNRLAWLLATCPQARLRDGKTAVALASKANELTGGENPIILHTLAAALAESGRYPEAVETAQRALNLSQLQSRSRLADALESELNLYEAGRPFHSPAPEH